jgi:hypothetical protein
MAKSIKVHQKKRGRPATGRDPAVTVRLPKAVLDGIESWAALQEDQPARSPAIRRLVELALKVKTPEKPVNKPGRRQRAQELAANAIEKIIDPSAPPEEHVQRKHRLTKGPSEFRKDRVDLPKPKR